MSLNPVPQNPVSMQNPVRDYDWGSTTALAELAGRVPTGGPEAELWIGAHPSAPSWLIDDDQRLPLDQAIEARPEALLGADCVQRFGARLPFLTKLLAIQRALSVQVHPTAQQALAGFAAERAGPPPPGGYRFTDPGAKPELVYALRPMQVLAGCRTSAASAQLLDQLIDQLPGGSTSLLARVRGSVDAGVTGVLGMLARWTPEQRAGLAVEAVAACAVAPAEPDGELDWIRRLAEQHPGDPLVIAPLLLRLVRLPVGGTMFLPAGVPHAYLSGLGLEVMAASDNVVRAGLTSKRVDADALVALLDPAAEPVLDLPVERYGPGEHGWRPPTPYFRLSRITPVAGQDVVLAAATGPQVLVCTRGSAVVRVDRELAVPAGGSVFIAAGAGQVVVGGDVEVFRTTLGDPVTSGP